MSETSDKVALIRDNGLFQSLALILSPHFKKVYYSTPTSEEDACIFDCVIGRGWEPQIERVDDPLTVIDEVDIAIFPHLGNVGMQEVFRRLGKRVWGAGAQCELERRRLLFRETQAKLGLDVPEYVVVEGLTKMAKHLLPLTDKWIKYPGKHRSNWETWHWRSWDEDWVELYTRLVTQFGPIAELTQFIIEDPIKTKLEIGGDLLSIDGQWPSHAVVGQEAKDQVYLACLKPWAEVPSEIREVIEPFGPMLKECEYRASLSTEQRKTKRDNFFTDITTRFGFPSGNSQFHLYGNLADLMWNGADGTLIPIEPAGTYAIEILVEQGESYSRANRWRSLKLPKEAAQWYAPFRAMMKDGVYWLPPLEKADRSLGVITGIGDTIAEACEHVQEVVEMFDNQPVDIRTDVIADLLREAQEANKQGIEMTSEEVPDPADVLEVE